MANPLADFYVEKGDSLVATAYKVSFLIPSYFFIDRLAEDFGSKVQTYFIFNAIVQQTEKSKPEKRTILLPVKWNLFFDETYTDTIDGQKVNVYVVNKGTTFVDSVNIVQTADSMKAIFEIISKAQFRDVPYESLVKIFFETAALNKVNTGATPVIFEAIVSELARFKTNPTIPFRIPFAAGKATKEDFIFTKIKEIPKLNSTFGGLGFENIVSATQSGVVRGLKDEKENISPLEKVSRY